MVKATEWGEFARQIRYQQGDFKKLQTYITLVEQCARLEKEWGAKGHRIFYMATPPSLFGEIPKSLGKAGLTRDTFASRPPEAYETLPWDVMKNDATLFLRADQVEAAWTLLMPVLEVWKVAPPSDFPNYAAGTWGPEDGQGLLAQGHTWRLPTALVGDKKKAKTS